MNGILRRTAGDALHDYDGHSRIPLHVTSHITSHHTLPPATFPDFAPSWIELGGCASAMQTMLLGLPRMFCGRAAQLRLFVTSRAGEVIETSPTVKMDTLDMVR
jgi:hypothetical protein